MVSWFRSSWILKAVMLYRIMWMHADPVLHSHKAQNKMWLCVAGRMSLYVAWCDPSDFALRWLKKSDKVTKTCGNPEVGWKAVHLQACDLYAEQSLDIVWGETVCVNYPSDMKTCVCIVKKYCRRINVLQNAPLSLTLSISLFFLIILLPLLCSPLLT